jgi:methylated-DNA-[protein]-cysteine S-methyltransferase
MSAMTPQSQHASSTARHLVVESPIGPLTVISDGAALTGLYFRGHWTRPDASSFGGLVGEGEDPLFDDVRVQLGEYFAGRRRRFELALRLVGSSAAHAVWSLLREIPYGETTTYGAIAKQLGGSTTARDVGGFVAHNPLSILVPCHRVVGATGSLTGYAGGLRRKRYLLELEGALPAEDPMLW